MTVTVTLDETTARAMFPHGFTGSDRMCDGPYCQPTVRWLVTDEVLACETCRGSGECFDSEGGAWRNGGWVPRYAPYPCPDCNNTGYATVEIVSQLCHVNDCAKCIFDGPASHNRFQNHGTLTIGPAVRIQPDSWAMADIGGDIIHIMQRTGRIWFNAYRKGMDARDVTDEFGEQRVAPGRVAHPILNINQQKAPTS